MSSLQNFTQNCRKIIGAGVNYRTIPNLKELPKEPLIFMKPASSLITGSEKIIIPNCFNVNQEVELGIIIGKKCRKISECEAIDAIGGYCIVQDLTATNILQVAKSKGQPWLIGKGFDTACPVSEFIPKEHIKDPHNVELWCKVNCELRQKGNTKDLIFNVPQLITYISRYITLEPNDLILTGTPPNQGPIQPGDVIESGITGLNLEFTVSVEGEK